MFSNFKDAQKKMNEAVDKVKDASLTAKDLSVAGLDKSLDIAAEKMLYVLNGAAKRFKKHELPSGSKVTVGASVMGVSISLETMLDDIKPSVQVNLDKTPAELFEKESSS